MNTAGSDPKLLMSRGGSLGVVTPLPDFAEAPVGDLHDLDTIPNELSLTYDTPLTIPSRKPVSLSPNRTTVTLDQRCSSSPDMCALLKGHREAMTASPRTTQSEGL